MKWNTTLTDLLQIDHPIVCAPMLGITTPAMVAAIANKGGLGSLPVGGLSPDKTRALIRETKALTGKPFAVNLFTHDIPKVDIAAAAAMQDLLQKLGTDNNIPYERQDVHSLRFYHYTEQIEVLLDEQIPTVSFTFGILSDDVIATFKKIGVVLNGTATSLCEARLLQEKGIDIISAQGIEAGGHRGTFLEEGSYPLVGLMSLLPQIVNEVNIPVLAAGGIHDGKTIHAAFALGAAGVQVGTAFIASHESAAIPAYKQALQRSADTSTSLTRAFSGRWARGIRNRFMDAIEKSGITIPPYPIQNTLTGQLRAAAQKQNNKDFTNLWAGQSACKAELIDAAYIFQRLVREAKEMQP